MAAPISLSENFRGVRDFGEDTLIHNKWNSLEDNMLGNEKTGRSGPSTVNKIRRHPYFKSIIFFVSMKPSASRR